MQTNAVPTPKPGRQLWDVYYMDRQWAGFTGDSLQTAVDAPANSAAVEMAGEPGLKFQRRIRHSRESKASSLAVSEARLLSLTRAKTFARHSSLNMQTPTTAQLHTAIEVLNKLGERLIEQAAKSVLQLPETQVGDQYAARIEARAIERTGQIQIVAAQLESWRSELVGQTRQCVSHHV